MRTARGLAPAIPQWFLTMYCKGMGITLRKERYYVGEVVNDWYGIWRFTGTGWDPVLLLEADNAWAGALRLFDAREPFSREVIYV